MKPDVYEWKSLLPKAAIPKVFQVLDRDTIAKIYHYLKGTIRIETGSGLGGGRPKAANT